VSSKDARASRWEKTAEIFARALEIPAPERAAWLAKLTGLDEVERREVLSLLEANENAGGFLTPGRSHKLLLRRKPVP
jgi:hypothetical protein